MSAQQVEASVDALITKLRAGLNTKIDAINTDQTDLVLDHVPDQQIDLGTRPDFPFPWIMVLPEDSSPSTDTGGLVEWRHRVLLVTWVSDPDPASLARKLLRYERAVRDTALAGRQLTSGGYGIGHEGDRRGRMFREQPGAEYVSYCSSLFWILNQQTLG